MDIARADPCFTSSLRSTDNVLERLPKTLKFSLEWALTRLGMVKRSIIHFMFCAFGMFGINFAPLYPLI